MPVPSREGVHKRSLLRDNVYESIRDAIVDGTLAPGERLRDSELEQWLGVSRTPIREALLRLERAGLVVSEPGRSTTVAPYDPEATRHAREVVAALHELVTRLAAPSLDEALLARMAEANAAFAAAVEAGDVEAALAADGDFHGVLIAASGNPVAASALEQAGPVLRRAERLRFGGREAHGSVAVHEEIIDCLRRGDAEGAALANRRNWLALG
ncbi:GntR family transcriptional regulator [Sinomonas halotolerans]|uniref:GntR family transcriptional regulator n=1 Tax=Sinomonas halotolerans TaxID=1644133 RepID=A0ABU9X412_9MICC